MKINTKSTFYLFSFLLIIAVLILYITSCNIALNKDEFYSNFKGDKVAVINEKFWLNAQSSGF